MNELTPPAWRLRSCLAQLGRDRLLLAEVWSCYLEVEPGVLAAADRRERLRAVLDELAAAGRIGLPDGAHAYDTSAQPPLPRSVTLRRARDPATRIVPGESPWRPELAWASSLDLSPTQRDDLTRVDEWLASTADHTHTVPARERSLEIFGPGRERRIEELARTHLFSEGRLSWELLRCGPVVPPFAWTALGPGPVLLVAAGHTTYGTIRRLLNEPGHATDIGMVGYGAGTQFVDAVAYAAELRRSVERILYFGDLDLTGLRIPQRASASASAAGLPAVEPATALYELLLAHGRPAATKPAGHDEATQLASWMPSHLQRAVVDLLVRGERLVQEWASYELLRSRPEWLTQT